MDIWLTFCRKTVPKCSYCQSPITKGELMVVGRQWMRSTGEEVNTRRWVKQFRWHAQRSLDGGCCWLLAGKEFLTSHPLTETRGRKRLELTKGQREVRLKILRQRARLVQKLKTLMEAPLSISDLDEVIRIGGKIEELKEQIHPVGGVPRSWE